MKKNSLYWITEILQYVFFLVTPLALVIYNFCSTEQTTETTKFTISFSGVLLLFIIFLVLKKSFFKRKLEDQHTQLMNHISDLGVETDQNRLAALEKAVRGESIFRDCLTYIPVLILTVLLYLVIDAVQAGIMTFAGCLGFIMLSFLCGFICVLVQDATIIGRYHVENKPEETKTE